MVAELREYPRAVTTCANAYVQPLMDRYLANFEHELSARGFRGALRLMHSAGGLVAPAAARKFPIRLLESGPAGGGLATALFGKLAGQDSVISFDMGGTTAKACLVEDGRIEVASMMEAARVHRFKRGSGLPIKAPVIDMIEIGAGGGSIAGIDEVGLLRVGPRSAGADPGPACYGRGGTEATVTDANLVLGFYDPAFFLGGRMALDRRAALKAVGKLGEEIGLSAVEAAYGIHKVVTESMAAAARIHLVEKGKDPRAYAMVGFGGAGPAHAAGVARILGIREVIIPPASGAASCLGFLVAPLSFERVRSWPVRFAPGYDAAAINAILGELEAEGRALLAEAGIAGAQVTVERTRRHAPDRADARDQRAAAGRHDRRSLARRDPHRLRGRLHQALHLALRRGRDRGDQLSRARARADARAVARPGRRRRGAEAQRLAPGLVRRRLRRSRRVRPLRARARRPHRRPGDRRGARGDHRRAARRQRCRSTAISTCGLRSASRRRRRRWSRRARRLPMRWRGSSPIRSRSKSCGAGSSPSWTRCGSP